MDSRLLTHYNRELLHLRGVAGEFARDFPKIAGRLSLDDFGCADPYVERLLEGFAFMAARVQLKLESEFPRFTQNLLQTVYPHYLAPTPSMLVTQFQPDPAEGSLAEGYRIPRQSPITTILGKGDRTGCEYRTAHDVTLWPLKISLATYHTRDLGTLRLPAGAEGVKAAIRIRLETTLPDLRFDKLKCDSLTFYLRGAGEQQMRLYAQLMGRAKYVLVQPSTPPFKWQHLRPARGAVNRVGFDDEQALLPCGPRSFQGYRLLREYFAFPERFMFFELSGLRAAFAQCAGNSVDLLVLLREADLQLEGTVDESNFLLYSTPAVNLFPKRAGRIDLSNRFSEFHVVPDRTQPRDFEVYDVTGVTGYGSRSEEEQAFMPFYAARDFDDDSRAYYTVNRVPRLDSENEQRVGRRSKYAGSEVFISLVDSRAAPYSSSLRQLGVETYCTNRDLPLFLAIGRGSTDFTLASGAPVEAIRGVSGALTPPRASVAEGETAWRLISHLSLNYLSLGDSSAAGGAAGLRELLQLYADTSDAAIRKQIEGIKSIVSKPLMRRVATSGPIAFARGLEVGITMDEASFEGTGVFLLGAVLEEFFTKYVSINSFIETVLHTVERGGGYAMAGEGGPEIDSLKEALQKAPYDFDFFQAMRHMEAANPSRPRIGQSRVASEDIIRFAQSASLSFATSALESFTRGADGRPDRLFVNFFGLTGPFGPLPIHFTEWVRHRERNSSDPTLARFLDIFNNRMIALLYRAWAACNQAVSHQRADGDRFAVYTGTFFGMGMPTLCNRDSVPDMAKLHFSGRLACHSKNAEGLAAILNGFMGVPSRILQFIGQWVSLPYENRCRLGETRETGLLGRTAIVGERVWDCQQKFRIVMGPMDLNEYQRLLPGGKSLARVADWVRNYIGDELGWDLQLLLKQKSVPKTQLGGSGRLGWTTWIRSQPETADRGDLVLRPVA